MRDRLLTTGIVGTIVAALCCFTPILVWALALTGLGAYAGWVDYFAIPLLGIFLALTLIALVRRRYA